MKPYYVNLTKCYPSVDSEVKVIDRNQFALHIFADSEQGLIDKMLAKVYVVLGSAQIVYVDQTKES